MRRLIFIVAGQAVAWGPAVGWGAGVERPADKLDNRVLEVFTGAVPVYNKARQGYERTGPQAFVDGIDNGIDPHNKKDLLRLLSDMPELPSIAPKDATLLLAYRDKSVEVLDMKAALNGHLLTSSVKMRFDFKLSALENLELHRSQNKADQESSAWLQNMLNAFFIPQAMAATIRQKEQSLAAIGAWVKSCVRDVIRRDGKPDGNFTNHL